MSSLPSFHVLKDVLTKTFTLAPSFIPEKETLFVGLAEDSKPVHDQRLNYAWDGKSNWRTSAPNAILTVLPQMLTIFRCKWLRVHPFAVKYACISKHGMKEVNFVAGSASYRGMRVVIA
ncbi:hypothetical protein ABBQ38_005795 [Trebouxia sp. C0009 RCD-2024]